MGNVIKLPVKPLDSRSNLVRLASHIDDTLIKLQVHRAELDTIKKNLEAVNKKLRLKLVKDGEDENKT